MQFVGGTYRILQRYQTVRCRVKRSAPAMLLGMPARAGRRRGRLTRDNNHWSDHEPPPSKPPRTTRYYQLADQSKDFPVVGLSAAKICHFLTVPSLLRGAGAVAGTGSYGVP